MTSGKFYREVCGDYATNLLTNKPHGTGRKALGAETFPVALEGSCSGLYAAIDGVLFDSVALVSRRLF